MIKALEHFDPTAAAGLLARAALSLGYAGNLPPRVVEGEDAIRSVIEEARSRLGLASDDNSWDAIEKMGEFLDSESEKLLAPPDTKAALIRLAERGDLPSDLYEINILPNVAALYAKHFALEKDIIETTVRAPSIEQHFGPAGRPHEPAMISLFLRPFRTRWPFKDFVMLVAAKRDGFRLDVHQAWRIYASRVDIAGVERPVDWLRRFADRYGADVEIAGTKAHFFLFTSGRVPKSVTLVPTGGKKRPIMISRFWQNDPVTGVEQSALVVAIDLDKYTTMLNELRVKREDIFDKFVPAPRPLD
jgi:hypothetical protein